MFVYPRVHHIPKSALGTGGAERFRPASRSKPWGNHGITMGKSWDNHGKTIGKWWFNGGLMVV